MQNTENSDDVEINVQQLSKLSVGIDRNYPLFVAVQDMLTEMDVAYKIQLEKQDFIRDVLV